MRIPYQMTPTPEGYEIEAYTRPAFFHSISILVEGSTRAKTVEAFIEELKKQFEDCEEGCWPDSTDWMPGDFSLEANLD